MCVCVCVCVCVCWLTYSPDKATCFQGKTLLKMQSWSFRTAIHTAITPTESKVYIWYCYHVCWCSFQPVRVYLVMMKAVRVQAWIFLPALIPHGALMPGSGNSVKLLTSALMLTALHSRFSPPVFTSITTSPKCNSPSFVIVRFTCTHEQKLSSLSLPS